MWAWTDYLIYHSYLSSKPKKTNGSYATGSLLSGSGYAFVIRPSFLCKQLYFIVWPTVLSEWSIAATLPASTFRSTLGKYLFEQVFVVSTFPAFKQVPKCRCFQSNSLQQVPFGFKRVPTVLTRLFVIVIVIFPVFQNLRINPKHEIRQDNIRTNKMEEQGRCSHDIQKTNELEDNKS
jgi:hypothetical protein